MAARPSTTLAMAGLLIATLLAPIRARAIEVKKDLYSKGGAGGSGIVLPKAQEQQLMQVMADESDPYLSEESEKKGSGQPYADIQDAKPVYIPRTKDGTWYVQAKLEALEYIASKGGAGKGKPTGMRKALLFNFRLDSGKWVETEKPKWLDFPPHPAQ